jgi:ADP-ribose pyrophosphatase
MTKPLKPWTILNSKIIHQTPWMTMIEDTCDVNGTVTTYTYVRRTSGSGIIPVTHDGKLWMVQQYRHPIKKTVWQLPAEGLEPGEGYLEVAKRGLQEELGLEAGHWEELAKIYPDPGSLDQDLIWYIATDLQPSENAHKLHTIESEVEELRVQAFSLEEIENLIQTGEICDNWTYGGLYLYQRYLKPY